MYANQKLGTHVYVPPTRADAALAGGGELTARQLQFQRYLLDRALQPLERFDGYDTVDQFRESAIRYQLNYSQWGLALAQYRCTPAFQGYVAEAQRRLIEKMTPRSPYGMRKRSSICSTLKLETPQARILPAARRLSKRATTPENSACRTGQ